MVYKPTAPVARILDLALAEVNAVQYGVTARWVFYRLLQAGVLHTKADYKRLLSYLSRARKEWWGGWRPDTLTDDTREAVVRGGGWDSGQEWADYVVRLSRCSLDRWPTQETYVEIWFEAAAMAGQFRFHANANIPLLAFHGDISIPAKWDAAVRLMRRWLELEKPIRVMYYGDLDEKGLLIPESAHRDVRQMMVDALAREQYLLSLEEQRAQALAMLDAFTFERVGLTDDQVVEYNVPENPERPRTYQWEGLDDDAAQALIGLANDTVDLGAFDQVVEREDSITRQFRDHMRGLEIEEGDDEEVEE